MKKTLLAIALFLFGGVCFAQGTSTGGGQGNGGGSGTVTSISCVSGCTVANPTTTPAITVTASGGTVTNIATTTPLSGGPITTTGTLSCPTCAITSSSLAQFAATTSAQLAGVISDETGTGVVVFSISPILVTPALGTPSALVLTNATGLPIGGISATGTPSSATYLRGDGSWNTPSGGTSGIPFGPGAGSVNVMTVTSSTGGVTNATGQMVNVLTNLANTTTTPTLNADGAGAETILKLGSGGALIALQAADYGATAGAYYSTFYNNGTNWILLNPVTSQPGKLIYFDAAGNMQCTSAASCSIGGTNALAAIASGQYRGSIANTTTVWGGYDDALNGASVAAALVLKGGDATGTGSTVAGSILSRPGGVTSTTGTPGIRWAADEYLAGATVTKYNLECESANITVADCAASSTSVLGVAYTTANPVLVVSEGNMFINASAAVTLGHTVCTGSTAGQITDSGGLGACTLGQQVGVVVATSGTFELGVGGGTQAASTTLPLIHLQIQ
jgi:hypothetical protein